MGDGLPSFAPQWLKSGSSSALGAGTHSSHNSTAKDEVNKGGSAWRESGSRLGLGAGTDRETSSESKPSAASTRRHGGSFSERSNSRSYGSGGASSYRQNTVRILSDRELVEQTSSLKLRSSGRSADTDFLGDPFNLGQHKNGERSFNGRQGQPHRSGRKPLGNQRSDSLHQRGGERDFADLGRQGGSVGSPRVPHSRLVGAHNRSPRSPLADQQWTSRLADSPVGQQPTQLAPDVSPSGSSASVPEVGSRGAVPRMADAILQAQASAAQDNGAAKSAKARMEQLALRQSKQLVPVLAGPKSKHTASSPANLVAPKKSSGMESLGRPTLSSLASAVRKDDDSSGSGKRGLLPTNPPPASRENPVSVISPRVPAPAAKPARERDRLTFFSSLRRKTSGGSGDHSQLLSQGSSNVSEAASAIDLSPKASGAAESHPLPNGLAATAENKLDDNTREAEHSHNGTLLAEAGFTAKMTAEEVAFMRSLGWEDADDNEGGLTEEEVAAFKAKHPDVAACKAAAAESSPLQIPGPNGKNSGSKGQLPHSFHSELEFSDSD